MNTETFDYGFWELQLHKFKIYLSSVSREIQNRRQKEGQRVKEKINDKAESKVEE